MSKMKTAFELIDNETTKQRVGEILIIGNSPNIPYVRIDITNRETRIAGICWIKDKDLERFAVNILKAIGSKKLKHERQRNVKTKFRV